MDVSVDHWDVFVVPGNPESFFNKVLKPGYSCSWIQCGKIKQGSSLHIYFDTFALHISGFSLGINTLLMREFRGERPDWSRADRKG